MGLSYLGILLPHAARYVLGDLVEAGHDEIWAAPVAFAIGGPNEEGHTAGGCARRHITPAIADHEGARQIEAVAFGSTQKQTRTGLPAITVVRIVMRTDEYLLEREPFEEESVDRSDPIEGLRASGHIRLVADTYQNHSRRPEIAKGLLYVGQDLHFRDGRRRMRLSVAYEDPVQDPVTIEQDAAASQRVDSHFISAA
jgi:hypothetical protein